MQNNDKFFLIIRFIAICQHRCKYLGQIPENQVTPKQRGIRVPSLSTTENSGPIAHRMLTQDVLARRLARVLICARHNPLSVAWVSLMLGMGRTVSDSTGPLFRRAQHLALHAPGVQSKFILLSMRLCEGRFHLSSQTKGPPLLPLQPLYTHWNLLPWSKGGTKLAYSHFISKVLFFLRYGINFSRVECSRDIDQGLYWRNENLILI